MNNQQYIESLHEKMHEVFKIAIDYLEAHNLKWYVSGGTAIGAIRHHDFIPWDDDIDIYMPREDYNKLLKQKREVRETTRLELLDIEDDGYTQWFAKFVDKGSTTVENMNIPITYGVWVDIFPLDYSSNNNDVNNRIANQYKYLFLEYQHALFPFNLKSFFSNIRLFKFNQSINQIKNGFFKDRKNDLKKAFLEFVKSVSKSDGDYFVSYCEGGRILEKDWFKDSEWVDFKDYRVRVPIGYDAYLKSVFGDYMVLPPLGERVTHQMLYVNLKERLGIEDVKKRIKAGETFLA